ncbi:hypothetical protein [Natronorubrum sp. DTA28]|uniref:hypothetical protein n=1 Tax=Natronorubrum sp. DTA28 TaxID=3447019 RepID=UPI003F86CA6F
MSLYGLCYDCGAQATLRYKPDVALDDQPRQSVCNGCRMRREERMVEQFRSERSVPPVPGRRDDCE